MLRLYVGETSNRNVRVTQSLGRLKEIQSARVILLLSPDDLMRKACRTYVEGRLYFALRRHPMVMLLNHHRSQRGLDRFFFEVADAAIEKALEKVPISKQELGACKGGQRQASCHDFEMAFTHHRQLLFADAWLDERRWVVKAGSFARHYQQGLWDDSQRVREELIGRNILRPSGRNLYVFSRNVAFSSANVAAGVVNGNMACGSSRWVVRGRGAPLKDFRVKFTGRRGCPATYELR